MGLVQVKVNLKELLFHVVDAIQDKDFVKNVMEVELIIVMGLLV